ncbi:MAG: hypothetical protein KBS65_00650 [Prevotella sp.]|nr:hypothetical protein [Candidatus Equicola stercoris]
MSSCRKQTYSMSAPHKGLPTITIRFITIRDHYDTFHYDTLSLRYVITTIRYHYDTFRYDTLSLRLFHYYELS